MRIRTCAGLTTVCCTHAQCTSRKRTFVNAGALAMHEKHQHGIVSPPRQKLQKRHPHSVRFKANAVSLIRMSLMFLCFTCGIALPVAAVDCNNPVCTGCNGQCTRRLKHQYQVADELGIDPGMLSKWKGRAEAWLDCPSDVLSKKKLHAGPPPCYPDQEDELYMRFTDMRKNCGFPIDGYELQYTHTHTHARTYAGIGCEQK
jgi:hypothetical protein